MRLLIDTSVWLWLVNEPDRLSTERRDMLQPLETEIYLSVASAWEISIKYATGKLRLPEPPAQYVPHLIARTRVTTLRIDLQHVLSVADLPIHHRDPFDRLLIAQAQLERLPILTADPQFAKYDVELLSL